MDDKLEYEILERLDRRLKKPEIERPSITTRDALKRLGISHMTLKRDEGLGRITHFRKGLSMINWYYEDDVEALKKMREEKH